MSEIKQHYYVAAGQILYKAEGQEGPGLATVNTLLITPEAYIPLHQVGRAQQGLQAQFMNKVGSTEVEIIDVILISLIPLGFMTESQFRAVPQDVSNEPVIR